MTYRPRIKVHHCRVSKQNAKCWYVKFWWTDLKGRKHQKMMSTKVPIKGTNKRKASEVAEDMCKELEKSINEALDDSNISFSRFMDRWLDYRSHSIRISTYDGYKTIIDSSIKPFFDSKEVKLSNITTKHIQDYYQSLLNRGLSANTVKHHHICINNALKMAFNQRLIDENPAMNVELPKLKPYEANPFTLDQLQEVLDAVRGDQIEMAVVLAAYCGLRRSEVLGLELDDIDFDQNVIHIHQTRTKITREVLENNTKSPASKRDIPFDAELRRILERLLKERAENKRFFGNTYTDNNFVCVHADGRPLSPDYVSRHFKTVLDKLGFKDLTFHSLRHTAATLMTNSGEVSIKTASSWLGHSNLATTSIYLHPDMRAKVQATTVLSGIINSRKRAQSDDSETKD